METVLPQQVELIRAGGPISQWLDGLGVSHFLRFDIVKDAQLARLRGAVLAYPRQSEVPV